MKAWMKAFFALAFLLVNILPAMAGGNERRGDEDPIPWACVDFSGSWKADKSGKLVNIDQKNCRWLKMQSTLGTQEDSSITIIVPDNKVRNFTEDDHEGSVRSRWNSRTFGTVLESYRVLCYPTRVVEEFITLEKVTDDLLLESTYRISTPHDGRPAQVQKPQQVLLRRRAK